MLTTLVTLLALKAGRAQLPPAAAFFPARTTEALTVDSLEAAELRFFHEWGDAYSLSQDYKRGFGLEHRYGLLPLPLAMSECTMFFDRRAGDTKITAWKGRIASAVNSFSVCPTWPLVDTLPSDERTGIDAAIDARYRDIVRRGRESVISIFAAANTRFPQNEWIVGQLVRLLVDQRVLDRALLAAGECRASIAWCAQLRGLVLSERREYAAADSAFAIVTSARPRGECRWTDVGVLLDSVPRLTYSAIPCAQRDSLNAIVWWLADPMWLDPINERRTVQFARNVAIALRTAVRRDERWSWRAELGGDVLQEMVLRYGWPSYTFWAGLNHDRARTGRYLVPQERGAVNPPYTTFEYTPGRMQTFPSWQAIENPLTAKAGDWALTSPTPIHPLGEPGDTVPGGTWQSRTEDMVKRTSQWWWPANHFVPPFPIVQLPEGERVFLRRQNNAMLAALVEPDSALHRAPGSVFDATLIVTDRPDSLRTVARTRATIGTPFVLFGSIPARPALLGIEIPFETRDSLPAARTRYAIAPPAALSMMNPGDRAISELVMLRPPASADVFPLPTDSVLPFMRSSIVPARTPRFGVYWETYGLAPTDTAEIAVWVERYTSQGILRNLGVAMNIARDLNTPVVMTFTQAGIGRNAYVIPGPVPVVGHSVMLDASALQPGEYWLDVVVRQPGRPPIQSRRSFTVQR